MLNHHYAMPIRRMNHAVLFVRDAERSAAFYQDILGFREVFGMPGGKFLQAPASKNDHDIAFFTIGEQAEASQAGRSTVGLYHIAWEVETLSDLRQYRDALDAAKISHGESDHGTTKSLYASDPDGLEFEIAWIVPPALLSETERTTHGPVRPLDLEAEVRRFGADTPGA